MTQRRLRQGGRSNDRQRGDHERDPRQDIRRVGELAPDQPCGRKDSRGNRGGGGDRVGALANLARRL